MKTVLTTLTLALVSMAVSAQKITEAEVPSTVKETFKKHYPSASSVKWEKEAANYEASFESGKQEQSVLFNASGTILETEIEIPVKDLPAAAQQYLAIHYKGKTVEEAAKITDAKGVITYEAEIKEIDILFDAGGKFLKEEKEENDHD